MKSLSLFLQLLEITFGKGTLQVWAGTSQYWWILKHFWCTSIAWKCDILRSLELHFWCASIAWKCDIYILCCYPEAHSTGKWSIISQYSCISIRSVASPICQEGQSERTYPIFAFPIFPLFFLIFCLFFPIFPDFFPIFGKYFAVRGGTLPPCHPSGYATDQYQGLKVHFFPENVIILFMES